MNKQNDQPNLMLVKPAVTFSPVTYLLEFAAMTLLATCAHPDREICLMPDIVEWSSQLMLLYHVISWHVNHRPALWPHTERW